MEYPSSIDSPDGGAEGGRTPDLLNAIQAQLAQSETRTATSLVAIYKALGGGWEIEPPVARTASTR